MKQIKIVLLIPFLIFMFSYAEAQYNSFDERYTLEQVQTTGNPGRSYIVLKFNDVPIDTLIETYNSIGRNWGGFESYYIVSEKEVALINQRVYRHMRLHKDGIWRSIDRFQLMYCRWIDGIKVPGVRYCCTRWKLEGLQEIYRSETDNCAQEPEWVKMDFHEQRQQVQHLRGGTPEFKKWMEEIREQYIQDSIQRAKN